MMPWAELVSSVVPVTTVLEEVVSKMVEIGAAMPGGNPKSLEANSVWSIGKGSACPLKENMLSKPSEVRLL